jgi:hypothetical protein
LASEWWGGCASASVGRERVVGREGGVFFVDILEVGYILVVIWKLIWGLDNFCVLIALIL